MQLTFDGQYYLFTCSYAEREHPREAGFRFSSDLKIWYTPKIQVAARLGEYATGRAKEKIERARIKILPYATPLPEPPKGLKLLPHQIEALRFALDRNRSVLGLDPGLGKTIVAATAARILKFPVIYVTPPFLLSNVQYEFQRWAPELTTAIWDTKNQPFLTQLSDRSFKQVDVILVPDSIIHKLPISQFQNIIAGRKCLLIIDECHRFKNAEALRSKTIYGTVGKVSDKTVHGLADICTHQLWMSGTVMPNRPIELYPMLSKIAPASIDFMSYFEFGRKFCKGFKTEFGWDFTGSSNLDELRRRIVAPEGALILRQKKELLKLPPKIEEVFCIGDGLPPRIAELDNQVRKAVGYEVEKEDETIQKLSDGAGIGHVATYRRLLGIEKARQSVDYIRHLVEETNARLLVFGYHTDAIAILRHGLQDLAPLVITGETPTASRKATVDEFQSNPLRKLLIGNYVAMGVGFTLTKANRVLFVEFDWVPGVNKQASDRAHRIGQNEMVIVQYVALRNSLDLSVIESVLRKERAISYI